MAGTVKIDEKQFVRRQSVFFRKYVKGHFAEGVTKAQMLKALKELKARFCSEGDVPSMPMLRAEFDWSRQEVLKEMGLDPWRCFEHDTDNQIMQAVCDKMIHEIRLHM